MKQPDFIMMAKTVRAHVTHGPTEVVAQIRPNIQVTHNYKRKNLMLVVFTEDQSRYIIPSKMYLEEVFRLHLSEEHLTEKLRSWCDETFERMV